MICRRSRTSDRLLHSRNAARIRSSGAGRTTPAAASARVPASVASRSFANSPSAAPLRPAAAAGCSRPSLARSPAGRRTVPPATRRLLPPQPAELADHLLEEGDRAAVHGLLQPVLRPVVMNDQARRDPGGGGHLTHGHCRGPPGGEQPHRRLADDRRRPEVTLRCTHVQYAKQLFGPCPRSPCNPAHSGTADAPAAAARWRIYGRDRLSRQAGLAAQSGPSTLPADLRRVGSPVVPPVS